MEIVLDTVSLKHLLRKPRKGRKWNDERGRQVFQTSLDPHIWSGNLQIVIDGGRAVVSEWEETCGIETVQNLIVSWESVGGIKISSRLSTIHHHRKNRLRELGLTDAVDIVLVKLVLTLAEKNLVSDDSDFWNPADPRQNGDRNAPIAVFLSEVFGINLMVLRQLFAAL